MAGLMRREPRGEATDVFGRFDRLFDEWMRLVPFRPIGFPHWREAEDLIRVEEFRDDGTLVIRADLPGVDPDKDIELTVENGALCLEAERHTEADREEKGYVRQELRYGSLSRTLPLPGDVTEADITASYRDGVLEVRVPMHMRETTKKVAISRS